MAYTIEQLFIRACSLVDSLKNDGSVDASTTADYRARTLTLVDISLKKLNIVAEYYKLFTFAITDEDKDPWTKTILPTDVKTVTKVYITDDDGSYIPINDYQIEYDGTQQSIYMQFNYDGDVTVQYKSITPVPTSFTDEVEIDDICAIAVAYDLAINFVATEQNFDLVGFLKSEYNTLKADVGRKNSKGESQITDYYGGI